MCAHVPIDISCAAAQHALVELLGKDELLVPVGQAVADVVGHRVLGHPHLLAVFGGEDGRLVHVDEGRMAVEVACHDINLIAARSVVHQRVGIVLGKAQALATDQLHAVVGLAVEHVGIVLHQLHQVLRIVETAGIAHPPVGLVLDGHSIHHHAVVLHPLHEGVQPGEELVIAVLAQLAALVALRFAVTALGRAVGLVFTGRRPGSAEDDATAILHDLGRGQRAVPVVVAPVVALEARRDFHSHDVQPHLRVLAVEQLHGARVSAERLHGTIAAGGAEAGHFLVSGVVHRQPDSSCLHANGGSQHNDCSKDSFHIVMVCFFYLRVVTSMTLRGCKSTQ